MSESTTYDSKQKQLIHHLIDTLFTDEELINFCAEHFRDVFNDFTAETGKEAKIKALVETMAGREQLPALIEAARQAKPDAYEAFVQQTRTTKPAAPAPRDSPPPDESATRPAPLTRGERTQVILNPERFLDRSLEGRYRINEILDRGGLGAVFKAYDTKLRLDVAVKIIDLARVNEPAMVERVRREVQTAQKLDHPCVVRVHDFGQADSLLYIIMEFISGYNLDEMRQQFKSLNRLKLLPQLIKLARQICLTVDYLHQQGVLHPGTKPENIMLKPGQAGEDMPWRPVLINMGLLRPSREAVMARREISARRLTYTVSPELLLGHATDTRSDVYTLGLILYDLLVGRPPFVPQNLEEAFSLHIETPPPEPRSINDDIPEAVQAVLLKALAKDPSDRYLSAKEMAQALANCLEQPVLPPAPDNVTITLKTKQLTVIPGQQATTEVLLYNKGTQNSHCQVKVEGVPEEWVAINPSVTTLAPAEEQTVEVTIEPPLDTRSRAKHYPLIIQIVRQRDRQQIDEVRLVLKVARYPAFESTLWPQEISSEQITQITIENQGNAMETFTIRARPESGLTFQPEQAQLKLGPGDSGKRDVRVIPRTRVIGDIITQTFSLEVSQPEGETVVHSGEIVSSGFLSPRLFAIVLTVLGLLACVIFSFYTIIADNLPASATVQAAQFQGAAAAARVTQTVVNAATATQTAAETATWLNSDADRDGLTTAQEQTDYNTDPNNPDTDGDTLPDGQEVSLGTDPLLADSDADGLSDAEERQRGLDPNNPDTDGDGIFDNVDETPGQPPTVTPTMAPIATAAGPVTVQFDPQQFRPTQAGQPPRYEVTEGSGEIFINVDLSTASEQRVLVDYTLSGGGLFSGANNATVDADYTGRLRGTLDFEPGQIRRSIPLTILDDALSENVESIFITLNDRSSPPARIPVPQAEVMIIDND